MNTTTNPETGYQTGGQTPRQPLYRPLRGRMLAGVAAGTASYLSVDAAVVRIVLVVLALVGGAAVPIYLAGWLLIPAEDAEQSIASGFLASLERPR